VILPTERSVEPGGKRRATGGGNKTVAQFLRLQDALLPNELLFGKFDTT
jgi:hypothetical protein